MDGELLQDIGLAKSRDGLFLDRFDWNGLADDGVAVSIRQAPAKTAEANRHKAVPDSDTTAPTRIHRLEWIQKCF